MNPADSLASLGSLAHRHPLLLMAVAYVPYGVRRRVAVGEVA